MNYTRKIGSCLYVCFAHHTRLPFVKCLLVSGSHLGNVPRRGKWSHILPIYNKWMYLGNYFFSFYLKGFQEIFYFHFFQFLFWKESNTINPRYIGLYLGNFDMGLLALTSKGFWPLGNNMSIFYMRIFERWYFGLCWNLGINYSVIIISWRILVSFRGLFWRLGIFLLWWNIWVSIILVLL